MPMEHHSKTPAESGTTPTQPTDAPTQPADPTAQLTPNRGGDLVEGDISLRETLADPGSYQSNHATTGNGPDDDRADADDYKVTGQSRG